MLNIASLNQRVNALTAKINNIPPGGVQNLSQVLQEGNSAGAFDIDMNNQDILNGNDIQIQTINGIPIATFQDTLNQVLINGNTTDQSIIFDASAPDGRTATLENYRLYMNQGDSVAEYRGDYLQINNNLTGEQTTLEPASLTFDGADTTTLNKSGLTTTADLTLDVGNKLILNGSLTETSAGGYSGNYLKLTINGVVYKLQLLVE